MKEGIHPEWFPEAKVSCVCGNTWTTGATVPAIRTDICSNCHPFYTGEQRIVDTEGRVDIFMKRLRHRDDIHAEADAREAAKTPLDLQIAELKLGKRYLNALTESGINVGTIEMKKTNVPGPVQPSFNEVNQATQEKEKMIYQANEDYNKAIPTAKGEAERTIRAAEGYALDRINRAKGDVARFRAVYTEYVKAKDVTKRRLYLEMLKDLFPKLGPKYIIDSDQKNLLPLLNLGKQGAEK